MEKARVVLTVQGMTCGHCVAAVKKALETVPGVETVEVTLTPPRAVVTLDSSKATVEMLTNAVAEEGYSSSPASA